MDITEVCGATNAIQESKQMPQTPRRKLTKFRSGCKKLKNDLFIVEDVIDEKVVKGQTFYRIRWQGYSEKEDSWEPEVNLKNVRHILNKFKNSHKIQIDLTKNMKRSSSASSFTDNNDSNDYSNDSSKIRKSKQRRFEYVPQSEIVASKTKYFDDVRDGKIDLVSNDLYSRVKTRRRALGGTESSTSSIQDEKIDSETENCLTMASYNSALSSPPIHSDLDKHFFDNNSHPEDSKNNISDKSPQQYELIEIYESQSNASKISSVFSVNEEANEKKSPEEETKLTNPENEDFQNNNPNGEVVSGAENFDSTTISESVENSNLDPPVDQFYSDDFPDANSDETRQSFSIKKSNSGLSIDEEKPKINEKIVNNVGDLIREYSNLFAAKISSSTSLSQLGKYEPKRIEIKDFDHFERIAHFNSKQLDIISDQDIENIAREIGSSGNLLSYAITSVEEHTNFIWRCLQLKDLELNSIIESKTNLPLLHVSVCLNRLQSTKMLLNAGIRLNETESVSGLNRTPLAMAIYSGNYNILVLLIINGANFYQVETESTALKLIQKLLECHTLSSSSVNENNFNGHAKQIPLLSDINVIKIPNFILTHAVFKKPLLSDSNQNVSFIRSSSTAAATTSTISPQNSNTAYQDLPPVNILRMMYDFISINHANLTTKANQVVDKWLFDNNLCRHYTLSKSNWISIRDQRTSLSIEWPLPKKLHSNEKDEFPILLLIHGNIIGPGVYHLWLDNSGPCLIKSVIMGGVVQRSLGSGLFVSTLFPSCWDEIIKYDIQVEFLDNSDSYSYQSCDCIAPLALSVKFAKSQNNSQVKA